MSKLYKHKLQIKARSPMKRLDGKTSQNKKNKAIDQKWIDSSPYQKLQACPGVSGSQISKYNRSRKNNGGMTGKRNIAHTLVAHHQVCQTLKENKSTVSREQGIMGNCVTLTCRHLLDSRCLLLEECWDKGKAGERSSGGHTNRVSLMSIKATQKGCNASSVTYYASFRKLKST